MKQYEEILKSLDVAAKTARRAIIGSSKLDDKIRFSKLEKEINTSRRHLRLQYFVYEDAVNAAKGTKLELVEQYVKA